MPPIVPQDVQSPFDALCGEDGRWPTRKLQTLMGYSRWENLTSALNRAMASARNEGLDVDTLFLRSQENPSKRGGRPREDFRLTRHAAYLLAMNGDPNKPEVAAAQSYFAAKTREAELAQQPGHMIPTTFADALELAARQARELETVRGENAELVATVDKLSPKARRAEQYETNPGISPTEFHKTWFPAVRHSVFFEHLYRKDYLIDERNKRWDERRQEWKDGPHHMWPTAKGKRYFYLHPSIDTRGFRREQTLVIPGDAEHDLVAALERDGLPSRNRPALPGAVVQLPVQRQIGGVR